MKPWYRYRTEETKNKLRLAKLDEKNPAWKGAEVGYPALHKWIKRRLPKPELCQICKDVPPYDLANISGQYLRDINDFQWLCRRCHMLSDNRLKMLQTKRFKDMSMRKCSICNSDKTIIRKANGRPLWYFYNEFPDKFVCHKCYTKNKMRKIP